MSDASTTKELPPPVLERIGMLRWLHKNLFSSWHNSLFTLLTLYVLYLLLPPLIEWAVLRADWLGGTREACDSGGACWVFTTVRFDQFIYGFYPEAEHWRMNVVMLGLVVLMIPLFVKRMPGKTWLGAFILFVYPPLSFLLLRGGVLGIPLVESSQWGGMTLNLILAGIGCVAALPLGILLALGRRATNMPVVKALCVVFIEFWRGIPLITVLFMASVMLPLFLPEGVTFDKLLRALIGITLFQSAYMAEVIRGGLQAIPQGQYEAADALGLGYTKKTTFIILPQALKIVIPGIVNTFIALFKDTTLVWFIGILEVLGMVQAALADTHWLGFSWEGYAFIALCFWAFCFGMSRYSQYLERMLHT